MFVWDFNADDIFAGDRCQNAYRHDFESHHEVFRETFNFCNLCTGCGEIFKSRDDGARTYIDNITIDLIFFELFFNLLCI